MKTLPRMAALWLLGGCLLLPINAGETAVVQQGRINVRGRASLSSEVITQLKQGEKVDVLDEITIEHPKASEPAKWYRIAMPANTPVWVHADYVDTNKTVRTAKLNVRAGPGENYSIIGRLEKGATVKDIRVENGWMEIETPPNCHAFVAADYVTKEEPDAPKTGVAQTPEAKPAEPKTEEPKPAETKVAETKPEPAPEPKPEPKPEPAPVKTEKAESIPAPALTPAQPISPPTPKETPAIAAPAPAPAPHRSPSPLPLPRLQPRPPNPPRNPQLSASSLVRASSAAITASSPQPISDSKPRIRAARSITSTASEWASSSTATKAAR